MSSGGRHGIERFAGRYPQAGGPEHCAGYRADADGFEVELVARPSTVD